jgi:hypothetical protein
MTLTDLDDKPIDVLAELAAPADLRDIQSALEAHKNTLKRRSETLEALLTRIYGDKAREAYQVAKKDTGVVRIAASNTLNLKVDVDKTVVWDQPQMIALRDKMTAEERAHFLREKIEVPEAIYNAAPPTEKAALTKARTVKPGKMKFTFTEAETN